MTLNDPELTGHLWCLMRPVVAPLFPRQGGKDQVNYFDHYDGPPKDLLQDVGGTLALTYGYACRRAFNVGTIIGALVLTTFCFGVGAETLPERAPFMFLTLAVLAALLLRDGWDFQTGRWGKARVDKPAFVLASAIDAVLAGIFLLASQTLAAVVAPALAMPFPALWDGAILCMPLLMALRMVCRPLPDWDPPKPQSLDDAFVLVKQVCLLNLMWGITLCFNVILNASDLPASVMDTIRAVSIDFYALWIVLQRDGLSRRNYYITLRNHWKIARAERWLGMVASEVPKGQPGYWSARGVEVSVYLMMSLSLVDFLFPKLTHHPNYLGGAWETALCLVSFAITVTSWRFMKRANYHAARVMEAAIAAERKRTQWWV